jgi:hypothetical protein
MINILMRYANYLDTLQRYRYSPDRDGLYRDRKGALKCCNEVLEDLLIRQQSGPISYREQELYGALLMTLVKIILKNHVFRNQKPDVKAECYTDGLTNIIEKAKRGYDPNKGRAYSYCYRLAYTAMIHVLEAKNDRMDLQMALAEADIGDSLSNFSRKDSGEVLDFGHKVETREYEYC